MSHIAGLYSRNRHRPTCIPVARMDKLSLRISSICFCFLSFNCLYSAVGCVRDIFYAYSSFSLLQSVADSVCRMKQVQAYIAITGYHVTHSARKHNHLQFFLTTTSPEISIPLWALFVGVTVSLLMSLFSKNLLVETVSHHQLLKYHKLISFKLKYQLPKYQLFK